MEEHFINTLMNKHLVNKQHILIVDQNPEIIHKMLKNHNSSATYTINGTSQNVYDFAWINIGDKTIMENLCNMLLKQFPNISIITSSCINVNPFYYVFPLTYKIYLITTLKGPIKQIKFLAPVIQSYNFNMSSIKYANGKLLAFRVSNTKFHQSSIFFSYMIDDSVILLACNNYHQNNDNSYEDPRIFMWKNELYIMYVHINPYLLGRPTKQLLKVDKLSFNLNTNTITTVKSYIPLYGKNLEKGPEKNWSFWEGPSGQLLCQYIPGQLLEWTDLEHPPRELSNTHLPYNLRGGAPGVIYNDRVYCFCHSPFTMNLGLVVYTNTDSPVPIGIAKDIIKESDYEGAFFYVCGATIKGKTWCLTGGMTDAACTIIELDVDDIDSKIERLPSAI